MTLAVDGTLNPNQPTNVWLGLDSIIVWVEPLEILAVYLYEACKLTSNNNFKDSNRQTTYIN